jgi:putative transcriptional regulator
MNSETGTDFGRDLLAALKEVKAHQRGEIALETRIVEPMPASRIKAIRKSVAKSPREFSRKFGIPARTLEGWEQGRKLDVSARVLLTVIERSPEAVEQALSGK